MLSEQGFSKEVTEEGVSVVKQEAKSNLSQLSSIEAPQKQSRFLGKLSAIYKPSRLRES